MRTSTPKRSLAQRLRYPVLGALLGTVTPIGLLALQKVLDGQPAGLTWLFTELASRPLASLSLSLSTLSLFATIGFLFARGKDALQAPPTTDLLTHLGNRRYLQARLAEEVAHATRQTRLLSLLVIDVDHLKTLNESRGHAAGDRALFEVADALRRTCRVTDVAARLGGDEFVVVAPDTGAADAVDLAERIRVALHAHTTQVGTPVTLSVGVANLGTAGTCSGPDLLQAADAALHDAKALGGNRASSFA